MKSFDSIPLAAIGLLSLVAACAQAELRSLMLGIDVNCPPGLAECWRVGIGEGVAKADGILWASEGADGETQMAEVRTAGGRLLNLNQLAHHIETIRLGARLRSVEATVDGCVEQSGDAFAIKLSGTGESLCPAPLTIKAQWDRRKKRAFPADQAERSASERLFQAWRDQAQPIRIIGPLRTNLQGAPAVLEVREFYRFGGEPPPILFISIGIQVGSPYGLGESWVDVRSRLQQLPGITRVAEAADLTTSTAQLWLRAGTLPDQSAVAAALRRLGIGAEVTGMEATVEGRVVREAGQLALVADGLTLLLAPLTRKVQWDYRYRREITATPAESSAYARLKQHSSRSSRPVRVSGPLVIIRQPAQPAAILLEVRTYTGASSAAVLARATPGDTDAPLPISSLGAFLRPDGSILVDWDNSDDPDLAGYNIYRAASPNGRFAKINKRPLAASKFELPASAAASQDYFAVTAIDKAGNESARSPLTDARPPARPTRLAATASASGVRLEWDALEEPDIDSYNIYRAESPAGPYAMIAAGVIDDCYTDPGAKIGRAYFYMVTAMDASSNESSFSNETSVLLSGETGTVAPNGSSGERE